MEADSKNEESKSNSEENKKQPSIYKADSDLDLKFFKDQTEASNYICPLCKILPNPSTGVDTICCGQIYCKKCIKQWMKDNTKCPSCNEKFHEKGDKNLRQIKDKNTILYKIIGKLILKCPNEGCNWEGLWENLENHFNECDKQLQECKYKSVGCTFINSPKECLKHENDNEQFHFELALKYIENQKNVNRKRCSLRFNEGESCKVTVHPHELKYMQSMSWHCDGRSLENGCYSDDPNFPRSVYRFRCNDCDFDLCVNCMLHYAINE